MPPQKPLGIAEYSPLAIAEYTPDDIANKPKSQPEQDGFWSSLLSATGLNHPIDTAVQTAKLLTNPGYAGQVGAQMGLQSLDAARRARAAYRRGDTQDAIREATGAIPFVGPAIQKGQDQVAAGNYGGAAGTTLGIVGPMALGLAPEGSLSKVAGVATAPARKVGEVIQRTAAGAQEGGLGGAIAKAVNAVAPAAPRAMLTQALKPSSRAVQFGESLDLAIDSLLQAEQRMGTPIKDLASFRDAVRFAKQDIQHQLNVKREAAGQQRLMVDLTPAADAVEGSIPAHIKFENPELAQRMVAEANVYRKAVPLDQAEDILHGLNAEVDNYYRGFPSNRYKTLQTNSDIAQIEAKAQQVREAIRQALDAPGQSGETKALNKQYGALLDADRAAEARVNVAARQQPESLSEQIGTVRAAGELAKGGLQIGRGVLTGNPGAIASGAGDMLSGIAGRSTARFLKESQTTDALIRRAFTLARKGEFTPAPPPDIKGLLPQATHRMGPSPDASYVRGVDARPDVQPGKRLLSPPAARPMGPSPDPSQVGGVAAGMDVQPGKRLLTPGEGQRVPTPTVVKNVKTGKYELLPPESPPTMGVSLADIGFALDEPTGHLTPQFLGTPVSDPLARVPYTGTVSAADPGLIVAALREAIRQRRLMRK